MPGARQTPPPTRIRLPAPPKPKLTPIARDALATSLTTTTHLGEFVHRLRAGLGIKQAELADRAAVSRQWIVALEQGKPTLEAGKVLRTLETLGFEIVITPYHPPPPWMLRATAAAAAQTRSVAQGRRERRNTRRAVARELRLAANTGGPRGDVG